MQLLSEINFSEINSDELHEIVDKLFQIFSEFNIQNQNKNDLISFLTNSSKVIEGIVFRKTNTESLSLVIEPLLNLIDDLMQNPIEIFQNLPEVSNKYY